MDWWCSAPGSPAAPLSRVGARRSDDSFRRGGLRLRPPFRQMALQLGFRQRQTASPQARGPHHPRRRGCVAAAREPPCSRPGPPRLEIGHALGERPDFSHRKRQLSPALPQPVPPSHAPFEFGQHHADRRVGGECRRGPPPAQRSDELGVYGLPIEPGSRTSSPASSAGGGLVPSGRRSGFRPGLAQGLASPRRSDAQRGGFSLHRFAIEPQLPGHCGEPRAWNRQTLLQRRFQQRTVAPVAWRAEPAVRGKGAPVDVAAPPRDRACHRFPVAADAERVSGGLAEVAGEAVAAGPCAGPESRGGPHRPGHPGDIGQRVEEAAHQEVV